MGAIFHTYSGNDVFFGNVQFNTPVEVSFMSAALPAGAMTIITNVGINTSETVQFFLSFDDLISYLAFGKGVGNLTVSGVMFSDCQASIPGVSSLYSAIGSIRGAEATISTGGFSFSGVITGSSVEFTAEPDTMAQFQIQLAMTRHTLSRGQIGSGMSGGSNSGSGGGGGGGSGGGGSSGGGSGGSRGSGGGIGGGSGGSQIHNASRQVQNSFDRQGMRANGGRVGGGSSSSSSPRGSSNFGSPAYDNGNIYSGNIANDMNRAQRAAAEIRDVFGPNYLRPASTYGDRR